ncbi:MAG: hypothetical protein HC849_01360 [Oscillatoriales cyanobacterium RU_3_3]|nr:hypothetical protein [Oscillatoriales cyanobacterium RU_3_3]
MPQGQERLFETTVLIFNVERCTITGNLILNEDTHGICLRIEPNNTGAIAIAGNVLQGIRNFPNPVEKWEFLNTAIG